MEDYDLVIIGAGPTGLFATFLAGLRDINSITLEALDYVGGQIPELYPEKPVYDVQGIPKINAIKLRDQMYEQARTFNNKIELNSKVTDIVKEDDIFKIEVNGVQKYTSKAVLLCTGIGDFTPRKIGCEGEDKFLNKGLTYTVKDTSKFKDLTVAVVGGGDSALDYATELANTAKHVYIIHHSENFKAAEKTIDLARKNEKITFLVNSSVVSIDGGSKLESIKIKNEVTNDISELGLDALVVAIGHVGKANIYKSLPLQLSPNKRGVMVNSKLETNIPGVYAAGDVASVEGEPANPLIAIGGAQAYQAINYIKKYINPQAAFFGGHSSNLKI